MLATVRLRASMHAAEVAAAAALLLLLLLLLLPPPPASSSLRQMSSCRVVQGWPGLAKKRRTCSRVGAADEADGAEAPDADAARAAS